MNLVNYIYIKPIQKCIGFIFAYLSDDSHINVQTVKGRAEMKKCLLFMMIIVTMICSVSCSDSAIPKTSIDNFEVSLNEQTIEQLNLGIYQSNEDYVPINYEKQVGMWFTYMDYQNILMDKSKEEFSQSISNRFENARDMGVNTVYIHVRAFNDSYYNSQMFPKGKYFNNDFDPLEIIVENAHSFGLSIHAWINSLRCQTEKEIKVLDDEFTIKKWYDDSKKNGTYIVKHNEYMYLNPAYSEVRDYISDGFREIAENYNIDGFQIDDYFYPTTNENFDVSAFSESGSTNLSQWRIENINETVRGIYETIKSVNPCLVFGISPQGNIMSNYNTQYADVRKWASTEGYCDYIVPQIYFGFENESCPFKETVDNWKVLNSCNKISLVIGLCTYKIGIEDKWAGSGKDEWINSNVVSKQAEYCTQNSLGIAIYSYDSTFNEKAEDERKRLEKIIKN